MGQPITVLETKSASHPAVLRFETNRPLSGMGHERYEDPPSELRQRPVDELARRLFAAGGVEKIHINGSVVTVTVGGGQTGEGLGDVIRHLFLHYGSTPDAPVEAPTADADTSPESLADPADAPAAQEAADDAPAPDRPEAADSAPADQEIPGIPDVELTEGDGVPEPPAREPSAADPADVAAAADPAVEPSVQAVPAEPDPAPVEPTPDVERPVVEPLAAEPAPADAPAVVPESGETAPVTAVDQDTDAALDAEAEPTAG